MPAGQKLNPEIHMSATEPLFHRYWITVTALLLVITARFYTDLYSIPADARQMGQK
tara:strand:+ start:242 stop:409 length:168 start_codon:yes stop_codon:yes gene_type:complete